ncbi:MAG TPA: hypothetical protein VHG72_13905 [Polyangia bacterium]|nr:hypothetical protein [Polyangia bacterium]
MTLPTRESMTLIEGDESRETRAAVMPDGSLLVWYYERYDRYGVPTDEWQRDYEAGISLGREGVAALRAMLGAAMGNAGRERCRNCDLPVASAEEWKSMRPGEGDWLCWEPGSCRRPSVDWRVRALAAEATLDDRETKVNGLEATARATGAREAEARKLLEDAANIFAIAYVPGSVLVTDTLNQLQLQASRIRAFLAPSPAPSGEPSK